MKKCKKIFLWIAICIPIVIVLFVLTVSMIHIVKTNKEVALLKEQGYYNLVSVGDYRLNVAKFGNENGKHTIVGLAGLSSGDFAVGMRKMTADLEKDNLVVFVDRAGYGFSDDTNKDMTLEYIVEDYRKALTNAGIKSPYILMPHSIGGAYANYWVSNYPEEIEAVVFVDGSQLSANAFEDEPISKVTFGDRFLAVLAKLGFSRLVLRDYFYHYPDNYTEEEQKLGDALSLKTLDSIAPISESCLLAENAQKAFNNIVSNDVPKLYICSSWGIETKQDLIDYNKWINRQIEINGFDFNYRKTDYEDDSEELKNILEMFKKTREEKLYPYIEKMGNCDIVCLGGDHMIYEQKPQECADLVINFLNSLE